MTCRCAPNARCGRCEPAAMPTTFSMFDLGPGKATGVRIVYQCETIEVATRKIHEAVSLYAGIAIESTWDAAARELTLVIGGEP